MTEAESKNAKASTRRKKINEKIIILVATLVLITVLFTACSRQEKKTAAEWAVQFCLEDLQNTEPIGLYTVSVKETDFVTYENLDDKGFIGLTFEVTIIDGEYDSDEFDMGKYTYYCFMFVPDKRRSFDRRPIYTREEAIYDFDFIITFEGIKGENGDK